MARTAQSTDLRQMQNSKRNLSPNSMFIFFPCPNCKSGQGNGKGFSNPGLYACVQPSCLICGNNKELVICYSCNSVSKYVVYYTGGNYITNCENCDVELRETVKEPCKAHKSLYQDNDGNVKCNDCETVFEAKKMKVADKS